jgi:septum formation protein
MAAVVQLNTGCPPEQNRSIHSIAPMVKPLDLASSSKTRLQLLQAAGLDVTPHNPRIDEPALRAALIADKAKPRDIADTLAEMKARKIAERKPDALVLGCDQVLEFRGQVWGKPESPQEAFAQLSALRGQSHELLSAMVLYDAGQPIWRHVAEVRLTMRAASDDWLQLYIARNWDSIRHSVGGYKLEEEGIRLFSAIEGDYFAILGLPLLPLLAYLGERGFIST